MQKDAIKVLLINTVMCIIDCIRYGVINMQVAKFDSFKVDVSTINIYDNEVTFQLECKSLNLFIGVGLPTVRCELSTILNNTSDPQNERDAYFDGAEVALIKTEYAQLAVGKVIDFKEGVFAVEDQPILIDEFDIINQALYEHYEAKFLESLK